MRSFPIILCLSFILATNGVKADRGLGDDDDHNRTVENQQTTNRTAKLFYGETNLSIDYGVSVEIGLLLEQGAILSRADAAAKRHARQLIDTEIKERLLDSKLLLGVNAFSYGLNDYEINFKSFGDLSRFSGSVYYTIDFNFTILSDIKTKYTPNKVNDIRATLYKGWLNEEIATYRNISPKDIALNPFYEKTDQPDMEFFGELLRSVSNLVVRHDKDSRILLPSYSLELEFNGLSRSLSNRQIRRAVNKCEALLES